MRCRACNVILTDAEATRKKVETGEYVDMCDKCFSTIEDIFPKTVIDGFEPDENSCGCGDLK